MKKKYLITIAITTAAVIAVLVVANPFASSTVNKPNGSHNSTTSTTPYKPSGDTNWINPGKFYLDDEDHIEEAKNAQGEMYQYILHGIGLYEPGETRILELTIYNANPVDTVFSVDYRYPDRLPEGYSKPTGASDWVRAEDRFPIVPAHGTYIAKIRLHMPSNAEIPAEKWEFWIGVIDQSQSGNVITELCSRVLVTMG